MARKFMKTMEVTVGDWTIKMRGFRKAAGLSLNEVADLVGISVSSMSMIERGQHKPKIDHAFKIAKALNTTVDLIWIWNGKLNVPERADQPDLPGCDSGE